MRICESRSPVSASMPFMHNTKILSETSAAALIFWINPRRPCELMEMMTISARRTAAARSQVSVMDLSSVTYSFLPVFLRTS